MAIAIRRPGELRIPTREALDEVLERLQGSDLDHLLREILEALESAKERDDLAPVALVIESWRRTVLLRRDPEHGRLVEEAHARHEGRLPVEVETLTTDELRREIDSRRER